MSGSDVEMKTVSIQLITSLALLMMNKHGLSSIIIVEETFRNSGLFPRWYLNKVSLYRTGTL